MRVKKHLALLGLKVEDKVTGFKGVITSISFDLYGCVQGLVNPGIDKDGKPRDQCWFDMNGLNILEETPVMTAPNFEYDLKAEEDPGPADKPTLGY